MHHVYVVWHVGGKAFVSLSSSCQPAVERRAERREERWLWESGKMVYDSPSNIAVFFFAFTFCVDDCSRVC